MTELADRIAQLTPEQRTLLEQRLLSRRSSVDSGIPKRDESKPAPLSYAQERLWFLTQLEPGSAAYNEMQVMKMTGRLDVAGLERSLTQLAERHEALRTSFREIDGQLSQVVDPPRPVHLKIEDLREADPSTKMELAWQLVDADKALIFDIQQAPLWRLLLIRLEDDLHIFVRVIHHIISDGWSGGIFWDDVQAYYNSAVAPEHQAVALPELPISYRDFSAWQREWLQGERLAKLTAYWRGQLAHLQPLDLPTDHARPAHPSHLGAVESFQIGYELSHSLHSLARSSGVSLYMLLLTAIQVLLHRYTGQDDIAVGSPIANRTRSEVEKLHGFFVNTIVLRGDTSGNPSFMTLLAQTRQTALAAYQHQDLPFEKLVEELKPERDMSRNPLFDVMFALQNVPKSKRQLTGLTIERIGRNVTASKFDLSFYITEAATGLELRIEYALDLFERETILRMNGHLQTLLAAIVADPQSPIEDLPILTPAEQRQMLVEWNETIADYPAEKSLQRLFSEQAERTPDRVAIIDDDVRVSFQELEAAANRLAHHLVAMGVEAGEAVGVCLERSPDAVIAQLAAVKAGAAWLPLDPSYPEERLLFMAGDAGVRLLLTCSDLAEKFVSVPNLICLDQIQEQLVAYADTAPAPLPFSPDQPAYYLYTSGSTGQPKGVIAPHRGAVNRLNWMWRQYPFTAGEICCQRTALSFVDSIWEVYGPLLQGVPIAIAPDAVVRNPLDFARFLDENAVTRVTVVPSLLAVMLDLYESDPSLQRRPHFWITSGEAIAASLLQRFAQILPDARLLNLYGSSEVAGDVTFWEASEHASESANVPIGRPIDNTQIYLLNAHQQPVPVGIPGELYAGGAGLATGYLARPTLTQERFVRNPFEGNGQSLLFRTGDLARYRTDGNIEFLGRVDQQVKIRGHRIELGEIEAVLARHAAVNSCVVDVLEYESGDKRLAAYWVAEHKSTATIHELQTLLRASLPEYMIPSTFTELPQLPLTPNGKVDRKALPRPAPRGDGLLPADDLAQDNLERDLIQIWESVLEVSPIGRNSNFFDAGGHSLLSIRLIARIEERFGIRLPVASVFENPTVAHVAQLLRQSMAQDLSSVGAVAPPPQLAASAPPIPTSATADASVYSARQRVEGRVLFTGPMVGQRPLPYSLGTKLQRRWVQGVWPRKRLADHVGYLARWCKLLGQSAPDERQLELYLLANTWRRWRDASLRKRGNFDRWVDVVGQEHLTAAADQGRPRLLVISHVAFGFAATIMAAQHATQKQCIIMGGSFADNVSGALKLERALNALNQGGNVIVAGDGNQGAKGVRIPLFEKSWFYRFGAAELALQSGAAFIPVFTRLRNDGSVVVEFTAPFEADNGSRDAQIEELTVRYASLYEQRWPEMLPVMQARLLRKTLE